MGELDTLLRRGWGVVEDSTVNNLNRAGFILGHENWGKYGYDFKKLVKSINLGHSGEYIIW